MIVFLFLAVVCLGFGLWVTVLKVGEIEDKIDRLSQNEGEEDI